MHFSKCLLSWICAAYNQNRMANRANGWLKLVWNEMKTQCTMGKWWPELRATAIMPQSIISQALLHRNSPCTSLFICTNYAQQFLLLHITHPSTRIRIISHCTAYLYHTARIKWHTIVAHSINMPNDVAQRIMHQNW